MTAKTATGYSQTYGWNALGNLTWVKTNGDSVAYAYDAQGRRVRKVHAGTTTQYLWDGAQLLMQLDGSGTRTFAYSYRPGRDAPVAVEVGSARYYYQLDATGSVAALWNTSNGQVATYTDDPYGYEVAHTGSLTQPLRWKGAQYDTETGLYYLRARYYDPTVGRFLSEDPAGLAGGINPYTYADGDPVNGRDPFGRSGCTVAVQLVLMSLGLVPCSYELPGMTTTAKRGGGGTDPHFFNPWTDHPGSAGPMTFGGSCTGGCHPSSGGGGNRPQPVHGPWHYGNFCGAGGMGTPINATDAACAQHDRCYGATGSSWGSNFNGADAILSNCNQQLCNAVRARSQSLTNQIANGSTFFTIGKYAFPGTPAQAAEMEADRDIAFYFTYVVRAWGNACR